MAPLPPVSATTILKAIFVRRAVWVVSGLFALIGALDLIDVRIAPKFPALKVIWDKWYFLPSFGWRTWLMLVSLSAAGIVLYGALEYAKKYETQYAELIAQKLFFEIDTRYTNVRIEEGGNDKSIHIFIKLRLRFENLGAHPISIRSINIQLHRIGIEGVRDSQEIYTLFGIMGISSNGINVPKEQFEGMPVQPRQLTPFYLINAMLAIGGSEPIGRADELDALDHLVVTMSTSGYQADSSARLHLAWHQAVTEMGTNPLLVTGAPFIRRDYRRIDQ